MFLEEGAGNFSGFGEGGAGYEDEAELGGGGHGELGMIVAEFSFARRRERKANAEVAESAEYAEKKRKKRKKMGDVGL